MVSGVRVSGPHQGCPAAVLAPYRGKWVALSSSTEVLTSADDPDEVLAWLREHKRTASYGMFRVPMHLSEAEGAAPL